MEPRVLFGEPVDRCRRHGVWFDAHELTLVLERAALAARAKPARTEPSHGVLDAIDGVDLAAGTVEVATEAASSGVVDVVLEALGGLFSAIDF